MGTAIHSFPVIRCISRMWQMAAQMDALSATSKASCTNPAISAVPTPRSCQGFSVLMTASGSPRLRISAGPKYPRTSVFARISGSVVYEESVGYLITNTPLSPAAA